MILSSTSLGAEIVVEVQMMLILHYLFIIQLFLQSSLSKVAIIIIYSIDMNIKYNVINHKIRVIRIFF